MVLIIYLLIYYRFSRKGIYAKRVTTELMKVEFNIEYCNKNNGESIGVIIFYQNVSTISLFKISLKYLIFFETSYFLYFSKRDITSFNLSVL